VSLALVFPGHVSDAIHLRLRDRSAFEAALRQFKGQDVELVLRAPVVQDEQRSLDQNAYLHAEPFKKIALDMGCSVAEAKLDLMGQCWGWKEGPISGYLIPIKPSTSKMSKKDCTHFIDWLLPWAQVFFHGRVDILPPQTWFERHPEAVTKGDDE
jgi:hypothetical protein